jgi:hypothetical protein
MIRRLVFSLSVVALLGATAPAAPGPPLTRLQQDILDRYLTALGKGNYPAAFALLSADGRRYFASADNYASVFRADHFKIGRHKVLRTASAGARGVFVVVSEDIEFFDYAHQSPATATAHVDYGLLNENGTVRVKDPYHPWRVIVPEKASNEVDKLRVTLRKISFFTGRVELIVNFANYGDQTVTLLPYGRSVLHDQGGEAYHLITTKLESLTDKNLYLGLRLAGSGQYTGALTFFTPDRFAPKTLSLTVAPQLRDGADAPFSVDLPPVTVGS